MLRASLRGLLSRKLRLTLAVVAIVLGTGFLSGAFVLTDTLGARFSKLFESINQNVAVQITPTDESTEDGEPPRLTQQQVERLRVDGAAAVQGDVSAEGVVPFDMRDGDPVTTSGTPQIGGGVTGDDPFSLVGVAEGRWPTRAGEVAISRFTAEQAHAAVGDRLKIYLPRVNEAREFSLVGVVTYSGDRDSLAGETLVLFQEAEAQQIFYGRTGVYSGAFVAADEGVSPEQLRDRVAPLLPAEFEAMTGEEANEEQANAVNEGLSQLSTYFFGPFAIVAVLVGIFLIFNTFNIVVAQRARELALMRAMGASWTQVAGSVLVEAVLVGVVGATLGLLAGIGLGYAGSALLTGLLGVDLPGAGLTVGVLPVVLAYTVGILVTVFSAFVPAVKASSVPPLAAMREVARPDKPLRTLSIVGAALAVPGVALVGLGLTGVGDLTLPALLLGVGMVFLGVALLSPLLTRPLAGLIGRLVGWGTSGKLGVRNALRNPRRTAVTAAALMIGVTLVSAASVVGASFKTTIDQEVNSSIGADVIVQTNQTQAAPTGETGFSAAAMQEVREVSGVERALSLFVTVDAEIEGRANQSLGFGALDQDFPVVRDMFGMTPVEGDLSALGEGEFVTDENTADGRGWEVGDQVAIALSKGGERQYRLVGTFESTPILTGTVFLPPSAVQNFAGPLASQGYVDLAEGADAAAVTARVEQIMSDFPLVTVGDRSSLVEQFNSFVDIALAIVVVLLGLAILVALLGILNTLLLSIYERTRELGMLRAVGLSRFGVMRMVGTESVVMAVFGCLLGIAVGVGLGAALSAALIDIDFLSTISVPWLSLAGFVLLAALAGVAAALWPAWRAARLNVLDAIAYE
ncbi:ABC transporter permease [Jidongwangia harbinensis]|uniref:ABC transporter permease n=1 Tax=Jidongwangia harbinensis TaxID=2878561 RepID=UPI001CD93815|nr:ABC transporter permease [Jidongwangia harbinensis]MCA2211643.1 ABC transporter permease [Jidongwangia harbinensis]